MKMFWNLLMMVIGWLVNFHMEYLILSRARLTKSDKKM